MIYRLIQAMLAMSLATHSVAQEVDIASLGKLELNYDSIIPVSKLQLKWHSKRGRPLP